jgi:hypothetical protein
MTDRKSTTQIAREAQAEKSFAKTQAQDRLSKKVLSSEEKRVTSDSAKTVKLRDLREARDAAEREAPAPTIIPTTPEAKPKVRVLRPGVRARKGGK